MKKSEIKNCGVKNAKEVKKIKEKKQELKFHIVLGFPILSWLGKIKKMDNWDSFTISCTIEKLDIGKVLCDLEAGVNLMPLSMMKKLDNGDVKSIKITLTLSNISVKYPCGVM